MKKELMRKEFERWMKVYTDEITFSDRLDEKESYFDKLTGLITMAKAVGIITETERNDIFQEWLEITYKQK